jgi:hypothetical protein
VVVVAGAVGVLVAYNYDTWVAGAPSNFIGPNQQMGIYAAFGMTAIGAGLLAMSLMGARTRRRDAVEFAALQPQTPAIAREIGEGPPARDAPPVTTKVEVFPPMRTEPPPPPAPPPLVWSPTPAAVPPASAARGPPVAIEAIAVIDVEEEEGEMDLPTAGPAAAAGMSQTSAFSPSSAIPKADEDELEDLFGELEKEVEIPDEEEVHYECPNCHGIVREDDASCPHCHVVFEG